VVDEGEIITSAGVSAGIDMALHVVRRLHGDEVARRTARDMEYDGGGEGDGGWVIGC
jgi:transcriptional regulator GlxA family with amidase domain